MKTKKDEVMDKNGNDRKRKKDGNGRALFFQFIIPVRASKFAVLPKKRISLITNC